MAGDIFPAILWAGAHLNLNKIQKRAPINPGKRVKNNSLSQI